MYVIDWFIVETPDGNSPWTKSTFLFLLFCPWPNYQYKKMSYSHNRKSKGYWGGVTVGCQWYCLSLGNRWVWRCIWLCWWFWWRGWHQFRRGRYYNRCGYVKNIRGVRCTVVHEWHLSFILYVETPLIYHTWI